MPTSVILQSLLALAVCLAAVGIIVTRRSTFLGWTTAAMAAAVAAVSWFTVAPALVAAEQTRQLLAASETARRKLSAEVGAERQRADAADSRHHTTLDRIERDLTMVHRRYAKAEGEIVLLPPRRATASTEQLDVIADKVEDLMHLKARPVAFRIEASAAAPVAPARDDSTRDLARLRVQMAKPVRTEAYDIEPYPGRELIGGRIGKYYVVDLKNADSGVRYYFDGGKYVLRTGTAEFRSSLNQFIGDVLGKLEGKMRYDLFVRGNADAKPFEGRIDPAHAYTTIPFLKQLGPDRYATETSETRIDRGLYRNADLPNLRSAFMRDLVAATYPVKVPMVLEGMVSAAENEKDRNVELILFVDW